MHQERADSEDEAGTISMVGWESSVWFRGGGVSMDQRDIRPARFARHKLTPLGKGGRKNE